MNSSSPNSRSAALPRQQKREDREKENVYRTKLMQFFGRTTPIILQNDNGPCPLLAICNVLSLKNSLNLSPDIHEVSQEKLLSLVVERLIDSNSNISNKDAGYVGNQQQNIADAIDLLPRLTTGVDVNVKFRRIDDFEFTRESTIFDLLDIPLYHGWIVDPQESETADAIGSKSYNTLMGDLVSLEAQALEIEQKKNMENDSVNFVAATTAALGVPSPCLSRGQPFSDPPRGARRGEFEEEAELLRIMKLSEAESSSLEIDGIIAKGNCIGSEHIKESKLAINKNVTDETVVTGTSISDVSNVLSSGNIDLNFPGAYTHNTVESIQTESEKYCENAVIENVYVQEAPLSAANNFQNKFRSHERVQNESTSTSNHEQRNPPNDCKPGDSSGWLTTTADRYSSSDGVHKIGKPEALTSSIDVSEPLYEGEERLMESGTAYENQEPVYEDEVFLAEQVENICMDDGDCKGGVSAKQGKLIRNFMKNNATQLTVYGLSCLQEKVKERELCVFFRNNHFNTMFKYDGELYILVTDQGYIDQPDVVWEKLNAVNGNTSYMTGKFREFKMDDHSSWTWDQPATMASTADYLAGIDSVAQSHSSFISDLQLAITLQQREFESEQEPEQEQEQEPQQPQPQPELEPQRNFQQPAVGCGSRLDTGPQVSQKSGKWKPSSSKQGSKSKENCTIM